MQEMAESAFKGCALKNPEGDFDSPCTITDFCNRANRRADERHDKMSELGWYDCRYRTPLKTSFCSERLVMRKNNKEQKRLWIYLEIGFLAVRRGRRTLRLPN